MADWVRFKSYHSEAEARVVESFLVAQGIPVQVLGSFSRYRAGSFPLLVHEPDLERVRELIAEQERSAHLTIVDEGEIPKIDYRVDKIIVVVLLLLTAVILVLPYLTG